MTDLYYDCEFLEDGKTIELISIGMVAESGEEFYAISSTMPFGPISRNDWLMENVMPSLPVRTGHSNPWDLTHPDFAHVASRMSIAESLRRFILSFPEPRLWSWYGAYDHVVLCQLWGRMIDLPRGVPMWTNDLKQECVRLGNPKVPEQEAGCHNALADARHHRDIGRFLREVRTTEPSLTALTDARRWSARQLAVDAAKRMERLAELLERPPTRDGIERERCDAAALAYRESARIVREEGGVSDG